jgi:maltose O-acetyltransferase
METKGSIMGADHRLGEMDDPRTNRERMLAGDLYTADDPELAAALRRATLLADEYNALAPRDRGAAKPILAKLLGTIGAETTVRAPIYVDYGEHLTIGARTFVNFGLVALDVAPIAIGDDCQLGPNVQLLTAYHPTEPEPRRAKLEAAAPITIGDNVWLGGGAIVLPGVTIGDDSVIGAGSVVTKDVPAGVLAVGNPARVIRTL